MGLIRSPPNVSLVKPSATQSPVDDYCSVMRAPVAHPLSFVIFCLGFSYKVWVMEDLGAGLKVRSCRSLVTIPYLGAAVTNLV